MYIEQSSYTRIVQKKQLISLTVLIAINKYSTDNKHQGDNILIPSILPVESKRMYTGSFKR